MAYEDAMSRIDSLDSERLGKRLGQPEQVGRDQLAGLDDAHEVDCRPPKLFLRTFPARQVSPELSDDIFPARQT